MATILLFLVTYVFFYFAENFIHYNKVYGSIGTLIMVMVWIFMLGQILLIGYEVNLSIVVLDSKKSQDKKQIKK